MRKRYVLIWVVLAGVVCLGLGYWLGAPMRSQERIARFQAAMGWDDAQMAEYLEAMQGQMTPAEAVELAVWLRDSIREYALHFDEDQMMTTLTCIFVLKWLSEGKEQDVKAYCIRRIVRAYNAPIERAHPQLRDAYRQMRETVEKLAAEVPELQQALADSASESGE